MPQRGFATKHGVERAPYRPLLKVPGLLGERLERPLVGVVDIWSEVIPSRKHLRESANESVTEISPYHAEGIEEGGYEENPPRVPLFRRRSR